MDLRNPGGSHPSMLVDTAAVKIEQLRKSYGELEVLKGVSLTAHKSDVISLIGSSGSGKSTLLRCINLLETPNSGRISIEGAKVWSRSGHPSNDILPTPKQIAKLRAGLGMVFQSFNLWPHLTVLQNIAEGPIRVLGQSRKSALEQAEMLLARVGLAEKRHAYPLFLSGGQQQRVAIARALSMQPKVLLFDEPTSALDPELVGEVLKVIESLADEGRTMIMVTHEMAFARNVSSHVIYLHNGLVEEEGPPSKLFSNPTSERCRSFLGESLHRSI